MAWNEIRRSLVLTVGLVLLATSLVHSLPTSLSKEDHLRELKSGVNVVWKVLDAELNSIILDAKVVHFLQNVSRIANLQPALDKLLNDAGSTLSTSTMKILYDEMLSNTCKMIKRMQNVNFTCSFEVLHQINTMFQVRTLAKAISDQLTSYKRLRNINSCDWTHCNLACNPDVDPGVLEFVTSRLTGPVCLPPGGKWTCPIPPTVLCPKN